MEGKTAFLGGIFIYSENPDGLAKWYEEHFGMKHESMPEYNVHYISYFYNDLESGKKTYAVWSIQKAKEQRPKDFPKVFTINLRIDDLDALLNKFDEKGLAFTGPETHPEGKFAWMRDPDGNYLELWQDTAMGG